MGICPYRLPIKSLVITGFLMLIGVLNYNDSLVGLVSFLLIFSYLTISFKYTLNLLLFNKTIKAGYLFIEWFSLLKNQININIQNINKIATLLITTQNYTQQLNLLIEDLSQKAILEDKQNAIAAQTIENIGLLLLKRNLIKTNRKIKILSYLTNIPSHIKVLKKKYKNRKERQITMIRFAFLQFQRRTHRYILRQLLSIHFKWNLRCFAYLQRIKFSFLTLRSKSNYNSQILNDYFKKLQSTWYRILLKNKSLVEVKIVEQTRKMLQNLLLKKNAQIIPLKCMLHLKERRKVIPFFNGIVRIFGPRTKVGDMISNQPAKFIGAYWPALRFRTKRNTVHYARTTFQRIERSTRRKFKKKLDSKLKRFWKIYNKDRKKYKKYRVLLKRFFF